MIRPKDAIGVDGIPACESAALRVRKNLSVQFRYSAERGLDVLWSPNKPSTLKGQARRKYRKHREAFLKLLAFSTGGTAAIIELDETGAPDLMIAALSETTTPGRPRNRH